MITVELLLKVWFGFSCQNSDLPQCLWKCTFGVFLLAKWNTWSICEILALSCWTESKHMLKLIPHKCSCQPIGWQGCFTKREKIKAKFYFFISLENWLKKLHAFKQETEHEFYKLLHPIQTIMRPNCKYQVFQMNNSDTSNRLKYAGTSHRFKA